MWSLTWNETHLRHALREYERYNQHRIHRSLASGAPLRALPDALEPDQAHRLTVQFRHAQDRSRSCGPIQAYFPANMPASGPTNSPIAPPAAPLAAPRPTASIAPPAEHPSATCHASCRAARRCPPHRPAPYIPRGRTSRGRRRVMPHELHRRRRRLDHPRGHMWDRMRRTRRDPPDRVIRRGRHMQRDTSWRTGSCATRSRGPSSSSTPRLATKPAWCDAARYVTKRSRG